MSKHRSHNTARTDCLTCTRPVTDNAYLCRLCGDRIAKELGNIPALLDELTVTYIHAGKGDTIASRAATHGLPWSEAAREALDALSVVLTGLIAALLDIHGATPPATDPASQARWLLNRVDWIRRLPNANQTLDALIRCGKDINYAMDLHAERWYAGPCRAEYVLDPVHADDDVDPDACCLAELYAKPGAVTVVCRQCRHTHDVAARRDWLLKQAEDQLAHAELIGRALASMGEAVTPAAIRGLAFRGRIVQHGVDRYGRPTYRVGDVVEVVRDIEIEQSARKAKNAARRARRQSREVAAAG